jgi:hypothetical protein
MSPDYLSFFVRIRIFRIDDDGELTECPPPTHSENSKILQILIQTTTPPHSPSPNQKNRRRSSQVNWGRGNSRCAETQVG